MLKSPFLMSVDPGAEGGGDDSAGQGAGDGGQTFTQEDIDRLVGQARQEERRKVSARFSDYDDLKARAEGAKTVEQQLADLKNEVAAARASALRSDIAAKHGISAEDRDLFLTGDTEEILTAQAKRLAERTADQARQGGVVRREGGNRNPNGKDDPMREFTRELFGNNDH
jgi:hypothetical protein